MKVAVAQRAAWLTLTMTAVVLVYVTQGAAQPPSAQMLARQGLTAAVDEAQAWAEAQAGRHIKARELAERVLTARPESYVGHLVMGWVHHYGEANFARALYHHNQARALYLRAHGDPPIPGSPWRWHAYMLRELAFTHGDLEHYEEQLAWMMRYNELYEPDFIAEQAWPYMKLRRFDRARDVARMAQASGNPRQNEVALNALCAVEFEAGNAQASYEACRAAMNLHGGTPQRQSAVDFTNFAEAARAVFQLEDAERVDLLATQAQVSWYGNPWVELADLYLREGRYAESLNALREVPRYRERRPPHVRDAGRNDARRVLASFFLVLGRAEDAVRVSEKAMSAPDRRAHNSRDPAQDRAILALLDRAGRRLQAERRTEEALGGSLWERMMAFGASLYDRYRAWMSGRVAARHLSDEARLVGTFMIGTHRSAVMPPWLLPELVDVLGAGVVREAVSAAREQDNRPNSDAYYDAFEAEALLASGDREGALRLARRALETLGGAEVLMRGRLLGLIAESFRESVDHDQAAAAYENAYQADPGIFRRLGLAIPVRITTGGAFADEVGNILASSPRFSHVGWGLEVRVTSDRTQGRLCLLGTHATVLGCTEVQAEGDESRDAFAARMARQFHEEVFAPRVDLSQADANSLDGSSRVSRDPLETLFGHEAPTQE